MNNLKLVGSMVLASAWLGCAQDVEVGKVRPGAWVLRETSTSNSCAADVDCLQGEVCTTGGRCVRDPQARCSANSDCGLGSVCDTTTGMCNSGSGLACTDARPCATGEVCINGQCHAPNDALHCNADDDCRPGEACRNGVCGGGTARCDATTNASGADSCPFGTQCLNGECQPVPGGGTTCTSDQDCNGRPCINGTCGSDTRSCDATTGSANACPWGTACVNGACQPVPSTCDANSAAGQVSCPWGTECVAGTCRPVNQHCDSSTASQSMCPVGTWCVGGACQQIPPGTQPCVTSNDCGAGLSCVSGVCGGSSEHCDATGNTCRDGTACINGVCIPTQVECGTQAGSTTGCPQGTTCVNGVCQPRPDDHCTSDAQCTGGRPCINGVCGGDTTTCTDASGNACPIGTTCTNGRCEQAPGTCGNDATAVCADGTACVNGQCQAVRCEANAACPAGFVCDVQRAVCVAGGSTGTQCGSNTTAVCRDGEACVNGQCQSLRCDANAACPQGYVCDPFQAVCTAQDSTGGQCTTDANCPQGRACRNGVCQ